jgi:hypothetical protein
MKFFLHANYTPLFIGLVIFFKTFFAFSKVAFVASIVPSLEIPNCS